MKSNKCHTQILYDKRKRKEFGLRKNKPLDLKESHALTAARKLISLLVKRPYAEITNPAHRELVAGILETVQEVNSGKRPYGEGMVVLSGYKQVIQILALEMMRKKLPMTYIDDTRR